MTTMLSALFAGLPVVTREADPSVLGPVASSWPEERQAVSRAVEKRRNEYFASRHLARQAFQELGIAPHAVLNNADRSPCWPRGVIGSLSHTSGWCGVALARQEAGVLSLGVDAERVAKMSLGVIQRVLTARELDQLASVSHPDQNPTLHFSAKEAVYKALFPLVRRYIGFEEVEVVPDPDRGTFEVRFVSIQLRRDALRFAALRGTYRIVADLCVTAVVLT